MIERFAEWGSPAEVEATTPVHANDAALAASWRAGRHIAPAILTGGDLWRTLGEPPVPTGNAIRLPIDLLRVSNVGIAAAHVVAHHRLWRGGGSHWR